MSGISHSQSLKSVSLIVAIEKIDDRNAIRKFSEGGFQDVEKRPNRPCNRKWNTELKGLLNAKRITPEVYEQFHQATGLENKKVNETAHRRKRLFQSVSQDQRKTKTNKTSSH